jgi:hypothetical protein
MRAVETAAARPLDAGSAEVALRRLADVYEGGAYDCPVVVLTPVRPGAARVVVEVQDEALWWVHAADGPGTELHAGIEGDRYELLASLVRAVVAGHYRHGPGAERVRRVFRPTALRHGWFETFDTDDGPFTSRHFGREAPSRESRFVPY